jgi:putative transposase
VNGKRVRRLMRQMGLQAITVRKRPATSTPGHRIYPYLLRDLAIERPNQVWCADITYVPMPLDLLYLVAIMDWYSRYVVAWALSNSLEGTFCRTALQQALRSGTPLIFNTDQGSPFTAQAFTTLLEAAGVPISMDGRGRVFDNIFIERLWRTVKYEHL